MTTYKESGVDIETGDICSKIAYQAAQETFASRNNLIGQPVSDDGGFTGMLDMGDFYLIQNDDGVGTKIEVAEKMNRFDTLGYDLIAMVADDGICVGAEIISVTNTLDAPKLEPKMIEGLMQGLKKAAKEQKIVIPGGELAELGDALNGAVWNATAVGILEKEKVITGNEIEPNDVIIGLKSDGIRSNGLSLARYILKKEFGENWVNAKYNSEKTWGEVILTPSKIYHRSLLKIIGSYKQKREIEIKGLIHNTGGGIKGNLPRLLKKKNLGAIIDQLPEPHEFMKKLQEIGSVNDEEAYKTWNMGIGMILVIKPENANTIIELLNKEGVSASIIGKVHSNPEIEIQFK